MTRKYIERKIEIAKTCRIAARRYFFIFAQLIILSLFSCRKTSVSIDKSTYEPKIVIAGLLYPEQPVDNIRISRNFPVGEDVELQRIILSMALVMITDLYSGKKYYLQYNITRAVYEYPYDDLKILYGNSYKLEVNAEFDGYQLYASAVTTVPEKGLQILADSSIYGRMYYREKDEKGRLITPTITYNKSRGAAFYLASIIAAYAGVDNFIYENPPGLDIKKALGKGAQMQDFQFTSAWDKRYDNGGKLAKMEIDWFNFWFYSPYRIILYAADKNYYHFFLTHKFVQEIDGNLHEPLFDIEGDGIGYFGSAVTDTIYMEVVKK